MIRIEYRRRAPLWYSFSIPVIAVIAALVISAGLLVVAGHDPLETFDQIIDAGLAAPGALSNTLLSAAPLAFAGLAAAVAFRMNVWNIGGEGQLYLGAIAASGAGLVLGGRVPWTVSIIGMIGAGVVAGALWAAIPGILRTRFNTNEILTSLMLNYVSGLLAYYLIFGSYSYWRDLETAAGKLYPEGKILDPSTFWPALPFGNALVPLGFILVLFTSLLLWGALRTTRFGFDLRLIADSPPAGHYAGISGPRMIFVVMVLSGALAGVGGASLVGDFAHQLDPKALPLAAYGYTGIIAAALARYNPVATVIAAVFLGALLNAGFVLQGPNFPLGLIGTMQGIILFCVLGSAFFERYRLRISPRSPAVQSDETRPAQPKLPNDPVPTQETARAGIFVRHT